MSEVKHTPGPWKMTIARYTPDSPAFGFDLSVEGKLPFIASAGVHQAHVLTVSEEFRKSGNFTEYFSPQEVEANANFIDQAVNSHEELVEALKAAIPFLERFEQHVIEQFGTTSELLNKTITDAKAALAKAGRP